MSSYSTGQRCLVSSVRKAGFSRLSHDLDQLRGDDLWTQAARLWLCFPTRFRTPDFASLIGVPTWYVQRVFYGRLAGHDGRDKFLFHINKLCTVREAWALWGSHFVTFHHSIPAGNCSMISGCTTITTLCINLTLSNANICKSRT